RRAGRSQIHFKSRKLHSSPACPRAPQRTASRGEPHIRQKKSRPRPRAAGTSHTSEGFCTGVPQDPGKMLIRAGHPELARLAAVSRKESQSPRRELEEGF